MLHIQYILTFHSEQNASPVRCTNRLNFPLDGNREFIGQTELRPFGGLTETTP